MIEIEAYNPEQEAREKEIELHRNTSYRLCKLEQKTFCKKGMGWIEKIFSKCRTCIK